ncbi:MAG: hypothetical protein LUE99_07585 [Bacteroides sp.]|nr:hypothetical protein [Bacteroides sp.]
MVLGGTSDENKLNGSAFSFIFIYMKTIKLQTILLLSILLAFVACSDNENNENNDNNVPQVTTPLPGVDVPQTAGNEFTIKGNGFSEDCEIVLKEEANTRSTARTVTVIIKEVTPTSVTFIIPEGMDGIFIIIIKQNDKEYVIGKIAIKSNLAGIWKWNGSYQ